MLSEGENMKLSREELPFSILYTCLLFCSPLAFFQACLCKGQPMAGGSFVWMVPLVSVQTPGLVRENPCDQWPQLNLSVMCSQAFVVGSNTVKFLL